MTSSSPTYPLSLVSSLAGSPNHNDNVSITAHTVQSRELRVLDGVQSHHHRQLDPARTSPYADALKYGLGGNAIKEPLSSNPSHPSVTDNWVTVSPKQRVCPAVGPRTKRYPTLKPQDLPFLGDNPSLPLVTKQTEDPTMAGPGTLDLTGIILANPTDENTQDGDSPNLDTLNAMEDDEAEGMDAYDNAELFLNLGNIEDVEMSTNSSKRKRMEEGEE
ncbi:hypothetical protein Cgig2_000139 [Carnegiea gigantea]|uniref:Uncharacterized protein n=1 Tax=Carnegiea gigantea TaxID=171969 RepID=A0A9Q1QUC0_9CARY|nr:hypothetical protein Cgig2_000139 [Carnegiea gigantea]